MPHAGADHTAASKIRVGTASWSEPEFVKAGWYPPGLPAGRRLPFYAEHFDMVELNSSFYAIPAARMCERWVHETPTGFLFDVKCHRLLSRHATKVDALPADLRDAADVTDRGNVVLTPALEEEVAGRFLDEVAPLEHAGKLGALLLQMTPGFAPRTADLTALEPLLQQLRGGELPRRVVLELRHHDWLDDRHREQTVAFLHEQGVTLASIDGPPADARHFTIMPAVDEATHGRLAYLRLHGRDAQAYLTGKTVAERFHYDYSDTELDEIMGRAKDLARRTDAVHVVFNNNSRDFAPVAAERLRAKLGQRPRRPGPPKQVDLL